MTTFLCIAGHGKNRSNGAFDTGAAGFMTKGEHRFFVEDFFPAMKKHVHPDDKFVFFSDYNVYSANNIVSLAKGYGKDTVVTEFHFDATGNNTSSGGHVIIYSGFAPDKTDLAIRDVIAKHIGLAYPVHKGHKGISGRSNLRNVNNTANGGVNYRLPELFFGTNKRDVEKAVANLDEYAKDMVKAIAGRVKAEVVDDKFGSMEFYRVQVGAYENEANAKAKAKELKDLGQDVYIIKN